MNTIKLLTWIKGRKALIIGVVIILLLVYFGLSKVLKPEVLSGIITPEVALLNQETKVTITVTIKPSILPQYVRLYQTDEFGANHKYLTNMDKVGEGIYQKTFIYTKDQPQTLAFGANAFTFPFFLPGGSPFLRVGFTQRPLTLPPDPYNNDKLTLEGIDSDHDGLRDVLQREIFFMYPGSAKIRTAWWYVAKAYTYDYMPLHSNDEAAEKTKELFKTQDCLFGFIGADSPINQRKKEWIYSYVTNSLIRLQSREKYRIFSRSVTYQGPSVDKLLAACSFDPNSLPD